MEDRENNVVDTNEKEGKTKFHQTKFSLTMRIIVGAYLIYLGVTLFDNLSEYAGGQLILFAVGAAVFALAGAFLAGQSGFAYYRGAYVGGKLDEELKENEEEQ
jgi:hypothetical protein